MVSWSREFAVMSIYGVCTALYGSRIRPYKAMQEFDYLVLQGKSICFDKVSEQKLPPQLSTFLSNEPGSYCFEIAFVADVQIQRHSSISSTSIANQLNRPIELVVYIENHTGPTQLPQYLYYLLNGFVRLFACACVCVYVCP